MKAVALTTAALGFALASLQTAQAMPLISGTIPQATFDGSGIPNTEMVVLSGTVPGFADYNFTIGFRATPRFSSGTVTSQAPDTYFVEAGESDPGLSRWNVSYYAEINYTGPDPAPFVADFTTVSLVLGYDFDPTVGNAPGGLILLDALELDPMAPADLTPLTSNVVQGSQNLGFGFFDTPVTGIIAPPAMDFDPNAVGEYTFTLGLFVDQLGNPLAPALTPGVGIFDPQPGLLARIDMTVNAVSEPGSLALLGLGLAGLAMRRRRQS